MASATQARKPYRKAPPQHRETRHSLPAFREDLSRSPPGSGNPPAPPQVLQQQNEDLRRCLTHTTHTMETMETEFENTRHYMQGEMSRTRDDLEKMRDKFRRLQNSYTASQRANQDLEEKLHALLCKVERDKKTMDQEIVELTNRLVDAKNTIDKLEELNERYRQDCNLAVQLLKCNKSHFRNHKFADLPYELQEMVNKHMNRSLPDNTQSAPGAQGQDADTLSLTPADVVPTSVIARVLEKPEPLVLNSAQSSSSAGRPVAEDVFVHVDMTGPQNENGGPGHARRSGGGGAADPQHLNGACRSQASADGPSGGGDDAAATAPSFEKLNPYPAPPPPHPLYPGRKVIEFSSDDKVKIPKNSPLPNCTYATRQAISLSLVQSEEEAGGGGGERQRTVPSSPATSPPQPPSTFTSSGSSEEDLLNNWQRMFVEKTAPSSTGVLLNRTSFSSETAKELQRSQRGGRQVRGAYSDGEEGSSAPSWTASRESSLDTDTSSVADLRTKRGHYGTDFSQEEGEHLLMALDNEDSSSSGAVGPGGRAPAEQRESAEDAASAGSSAEERDVLPQDFPVISSRVVEDYTDKPPPHRHHPQGGSTRPQKSPKRMGVHHLHRKDSLTRAQEHGNLLD
uniref:Tight junction-associated protein 1 domain-containing protein n=1 Tax=Electrophorus electricus TaxID=8005 RepID=A0A4W4FR56_ELEEL